MFNLEGHHFPYFKAIYCHFMANFGPKLPYLAISGSSCLKWVEHWLNTVEHCISHLGGSVRTFLPPWKWPWGAPEGPKNYQLLAKSNHFWSILGPPMGISRQAKRSQLTILDVKYNVQPSLTDVQPIWGGWSHLWPEMMILGRKRWFWGRLGPPGAPHGHFQAG